MGYVERTIRRVRRFVIESSRTSSRSAAEVMGLVQQPDTWPDWQPEIISTEGPEIFELREVVHGWARMLGFEVQGQSTIVTADATSYVEDVVVGVRMHVVYRVESDPNGCRVTRRLEADLPGGVSGRILGLFLRLRLKGMQDKVLDALAGQAEDSV